MNKAQKIIIFLIILSVGALCYDRFVQRVELPIKLTSASPVLTSPPSQPAPKTVTPKPAVANSELSPAQTYLKYQSILNNAKAFSEIKPYLSADVLQTMPQGVSEKKLMEMISMMAKASAQMKMKYIEQHVAGNEAIVKLDNAGEKNDLGIEAENYVHMKMANNRWVVVKEAAKMADARVHLSAKQFFDSMKAQQMATAPKSTPKSTPPNAPLAAQAKPARKLASVPEKLPPMMHRDKTGYFVPQEEDCQHFGWKNLNKELGPIGFKAGAGGGGLKKSDTQYYCWPCVVTKNELPESVKSDLAQVYKPAGKIVRNYATGYSYHHCRIQKSE